MDRSTVDLFRDRYQALAGQVYLTGNVTEAREVAHRLVMEAGAKRVAIGFLPSEVRSAILEGLSGVEVIDAASLRTDVSAAVDQADVGVGWAEFAIAFTGTIVEVTDNDAMRLVSSLPPLNLAFVQAGDIVSSFEEAAPKLRTIYEKYPGGCAVTFISGPSRTGDIEMKLVLGVHGPKASHVIVLGVPPE